MAAADAATAAESLVLVCLELLPQAVQLNHNVMKLLQQNFGPGALPTRR